MEEQLPSFLILIDSLHLQSGMQGVQGFSVVGAVHRLAQYVGSLRQIFLVEVLAPGLLEVRKDNGISDDDCVRTMGTRMDIVLVRRQLDSGAVVVVRAAY